MRTVRSDLDFVLVYLVLSAPKNRFSISPFLFQTIFDPCFFCLLIFHFGFLLVFSAHSEGGSN
eukprot:m.33705 g.33705  ORF g.33705 m.33705 type:complete len:63 (-) comp43204_c0_seq1:398-586(-)